MIRWTFGWAARKMMLIGQTDGSGFSKCADRGPGGHGGRKDDKRYRN